MSETATPSDHEIDAELVKLRAQLLEERPDISAEELVGKLAVYQPELVTDNPELWPLRQRAEE
jgi:hypothetical protein